MSIIARLNDDQCWFRGPVALRIDRMTDVHRTNILRSLVERAEENQAKYLAEILGAYGPVAFDTGYPTSTSCSLTWSRSPRWSGLLRRSFRGD